MLSRFSSAARRHSCLPVVVNVLGGVPIAPIVSFSSEAEDPPQIQLEAYLNKDARLLSLIKSISGVSSPEEFGQYREDIGAATATVRAMVNDGGSLERINANGDGVEPVAENARYLGMMHALVSPIELGGVPSCICPVRDLVGKLSNAKDSPEKRAHLAREFIEAGYDVNRVVIFNEFYPGTCDVIQSPLLNTLIMNEVVVAEVAILLQKGRDVNPNVCDSQGKNALLCAAVVNSTEAVALLLRANEFLSDPVDVDHVDKRGRTALHYACLYGNALVAKKLVEAGARYDIEDDTGRVAEALILDDGFRYDLYMAGIDPTRDVKALTNCDVPEIPAGITLEEQIRDDKIRLAKAFSTLLEYSEAAGVEVVLRR